MLYIIIIIIKDKILRYVVYKPYLLLLLLIHMGIKKCFTKHFIRSMLILEYFYWSMKV